LFLRLTLLLQRVINARFTMASGAEGLSSGSGADSDAAKLQHSVTGFAVEACSEFR
jgi:hypothetical protein